MKYMISILLGGILLSVDAKVLDLGEIEVTGEVRRPNLNLVYSKEYFNSAIRDMAHGELEKFEKQLLRPGVRTGVRLFRKKKRVKRKGVR